MLYKNIAMFVKTTHWIGDIGIWIVKTSEEKKQQTNNEKDS